MEKKRILRAALAVWLCFSLCAAPLRPVLAVEDDFNDDTYDASVQDTVVLDIEGAEDTVVLDVEGEENGESGTDHVNHPECGAGPCAGHPNDSSTMHSFNRTWKAWDHKDSLPTQYGWHYLTCDVTLNGSWEMSNHAVYLCLNGHTITTTTGEDCIIRIKQSDSSITLCDCKNTGKITGPEGSTASSSLVGVEVGEAKGDYIQFIMYGGQITNVGHGVKVGKYGDFRIYGGEISGNKADTDGAGVYEAGGKCTMYGGKIENNTCEGNGAGVYTTSSFFMYGGEVTNNICGGNGPGVYCDKGTLYVRGDPVIVDNKKEDGTSSNVYLTNNGRIGFWDSTVYAPKHVISIATSDDYVDGPFTTAVFGNYDTVKEYGKYFKSEDGYDIKYDGGKQVLMFMGPPSATIANPPQGQAMSGRELKVTLQNYDGEPTTYAWYYNITNSTTDGTPIGENSDKYEIPYDEDDDLSAGRYYFYCVVKDKDGETIATSNTLEVIIRGYKVLKPGESETTSDNTTVTRSEDGKTVTIKNEDNTETTITLPDENGEVKVEVVTGEVIVPEGSTVKNKDAGNEGDKTPDVTIGGEEGGTVTPDGEVKIPEGGTATVDIGGKKTTITGGSGGTTVTPKEDGKVDVSGGGKVKTGDNGTEIILPDGGNVDPSNGSITPGKDGKDGKPTVGVDPDGDGKIDTLIVLPSGEDGEDGGESKITLSEDGKGYTVPDGTEIKGTDENGREGVSVTLPGGGTVTSGGGVTPGGDGTVTTGEDGKTKVTIPEGGEIKGNGKGGLDVPDGTEVTTGEGENQVKIKVGNGKDDETGGGAINKDGGVDIPQGGSVTVDNGTDKPVTTITGGAGGGSVTPDPDNGTVSVSGGSTVKTGENGAEITIGENGGNGGTVDKDGKVTLPEGGSAVIGGGDGVGTTVTVPTDGGTLEPDGNGNIKVPEGTKMKTGETGPEITIGENGGKGGTVDGNGKVTLPEGGSATITVPGSDDNITVATPDGGEVDKNGQTTASTIEITSGGENEKPTVITAPPGGKVTTGSDGTTNLPVGASVSKEGGNGKTAITVNSAGTTPTVDKGGLLKFPSGGDVTVEKTVTGKEPKTFPITIPEGGTINADSTGATDITGIVTVGKGSNERAGNANVKLMRGKNLIMSSRTNENGEFYLINISKGFYNIIASKEGRNGQATAIMESTGEPQQEVAGLYLPSDNVSSILEIKGEKDEKAAVDISQVVVGGLNDEAEEIKKERGAKSVDLRLEIAPADKTTNVSETTAIKNLDSAKGQKLEYLAVDMKLIVNAQGLETLTNTKTMFEIILPFTFGNAKGEVMVYRYHDGSASGLDSVNGRTNPSDGTYFSNDASGCIHIFTNKFSTFAIGYVPSDGQIPDDSTQEPGDTTTPPESENPTPTPEPENPAPSGNSSSSSSSGSGVRVAPNVTGGKVTISPARPTRGQTVTITVTPDAGYRLDSLTVTGSGGKEVKLTKVGDGQYTFVMPAGSVTVTPSFVKVDSEVTADSRRFTDVSDDAWYAEYVEYVAANGLMNGYSDGRFGPNDNTTRGQIITVLYRYEQEPETGLSGFSDVSSSKYYSKAVAWGAANGIVKGYGANLFGPEDNITREQLAAILFRFAEFKGRDVSGRADLGSFADNGKISEYAIPALEWAVASGLMKGKSNSMLDPNGFATRAEVAAMLMRFIEA